jgi:hypothetical protein
MNWAWQRRRDCGKDTGGPAFGASNAKIPCARFGRPMDPKSRASQYPPTGVEKLLGVAASAVVDPAKAVRRLPSCGSDTIRRRGCDSRPSPTTSDGPYRTIDYAALVPLRYGLSPPPVIHSWQSGIGRRGRRPH